MLLFGSDFDTDPQLPWAAPTLKDPAAGDQMARAERLWLRTQDFLDRVAGPGGELTRDALRRARRAAAEDQSEPPPGPDELLRGLEALHPQRCQAIGEAAMRAVAARAAELARPYAAEAGALPLFATLVFLLGHGVAADPQFPWAAAALAKASPTTPAGRLRELRSAWMAYLDRVLG
jgi:uncharacterized membrane protein